MPYFQEGEFMTLGQAVQVKLNDGLKNAVIVKFNPKRVRVLLEGDREIVVRQHQIQL